MKKKFACVVFSVLVSSCVLLFAAESGEEKGFGGWHLLIGGALNGGVSPSVHASGIFRGLAVLPALPSGLSRTAAAARHTANGTGRISFGDGFVDPNSDAAVSGRTWNWHLPESAVRDGNFVLEDAYVEQGETWETLSGSNNGDDQYQPGVSVELAHTLYEDAEYGWGFDVALAVSYFFGNDIYDAHGTYARSQDYETGKYQTTLSGAGILDDSWVSASGGYYGSGNAVGPGALLDVSSLTACPSPSDVNRGTVNATSSFDASGDYWELEMMLMARPWYALMDWWRVFGEVGVAVSRSQFDFEYSAIGTGGRIARGEDFSSWSCYGVAGLGTAFRYDRFDLSIDFLGRFLNDDLECNGHYVSGSVEKADWLMRVMVGVRF